jgi:hypothetical protein
MLSKLSSRLPHLVIAFNKKILLVMYCFFFREQAGELLVIVLSLREIYDLVYEKNRTQKPYK